MKGGIVGLAVGILCLLVGGADAAERAAVDSFSPQGTVRDLRQVKVRFSEPMVALGDPRLADPFTIDCPPDGEGRWVDPRNWVYDFKGPVPAGHRCQFTLADGLKTLAGKNLSGTRRFSFDSGGPVVRQSFPPIDSRAIDENQTFLLAFDGIPDPQSLADRAYCRIANLPERIPLDILGQQDRRRVLGQDFGWDYRLGQMLRHLDLSAEELGKAMEDPRLVAVQCRRAFAPGAKVSLVFEAGLAATVEQGGGERGAGLATDRTHVLDYTTRPAFSARFTCKRVNEDAACLPFQSMSLEFSTAVPTDLAMAVRLIGPDGVEQRPVAPENDGLPVVHGAVFKGPFPELTRFRLVLPDAMVDDAGRSLVNADRFPLQVETDEYPPLVKFSGEFGILELTEGGVLPVTLRGVEPELAGARFQPVDARVEGRGLRLSDDDQAIAQWLQRVEWAARRRFEEVGEDGKRRLREATGRRSLLAALPAEETRSFSLPRQEAGRATEVVGIPLGDPGFYVVELASPLLGKALLNEPVNRYVAAAALVTNMSVHFQWGRESSLVWVTTLDNAQPVAGARITVSDFCDGKHLWSGVTDGEGRAMIGDHLPEPAGYGSCQSWGTSPLMISARKDGDMSFNLTNWNDGLSPWDFNLDAGSAEQAGIIATVFDRGLYRAGETVSMKHFLRRHTRHGLAAPTTFRPARKVVITHGGSDRKYEYNAAFDTGGIGESQWRIPEDAALGFYSVQVMDDQAGLTWSGSFRVEEFRLPTMKATIQGPKAPQINVSQVTLDLFLEYLSGGGAGGVPVKLRTQTETYPVRFKGYEAFSFAADPVEPGVRASNQPPSAAQALRSRVMPLTLDRQGVARVDVPDIPPLQQPSRLVAEMEYQDANGEILTVARRIPLWHSAVLLGIRMDDWLGSEDKVKFQVVALDPDGTAVAGRPVTVKAYHRLRYSYRKRLIGGFYSYSDSEEIRPLPMQCQGTSDARGLVHCEMAPGVSGEVVLRAESSDAAGNPTFSTRTVWVVGEESWWFSGTDSDRMDVLPGKPEYETGEVARFQVRMPFREATALVTINREGVMESFVTHLQGRDPVIELPIKDSYAPNVFVSVLAVRGRVLGDRADLPGGGAPTGLVDLRKPAFRLGMAKIRVGWTPHRLDVTVTPERKHYRARETARVRINVARADGSVLPAGTEFALAAVDEGLLQLKSNESWDLLAAMMDQRRLEVHASTAQMQVVGKRHYGRKAVAQGGGGGASGLQARELLDTLLLWRGRVKVNEIGEAEVDIPLNDSLTTFRIVAIANNGVNHYGTGESQIITTQDLIIHAGLPEMVREGDRLDAMITLRNSADRSLTVEAVATVEETDQRLEPQTVTIPPGEARPVIWPVVVPLDVSHLTWEIAASGNSAKDRLRIVQNVIPAVPVRTLQATLARIDGSLTIPADPPHDAIKDRGGLRLILQSSLAGGLQGVQEYMRDYPHRCLEQRVSRAVVLGDRDQWRRLVERMPAYLDGDGLMKYFPTSYPHGSDSLTSYVMSIAHEAGWTLPEPLQRRVLSGLGRFAKGQIRRHAGLRRADLTIRRIAAIATLSRYGAAQPKMLESLDITPALWPTSALLDWIGILKRVKGVPDQLKKLEQAKHLLRARTDLHGTTLNFSTAAGDHLWWLMINTDSNANRALIAMMDQADWRADMPLMMRGALARMKRGHWSTTVANAWGVLAAEKFAAIFEKTPVAGVTQADYGRDTVSSRWTGQGKVDPVDFPWAWESGDTDLRIAHRGEGTPWAMVQARAAVPLKEPLFAGYRITRTVTPIEQKTAGVWSRGDVARVSLEIEGSSDMTWVVVEDPVPAGATLLGSGLGGDTARLVSDERVAGRAWPAFEERGFTAFRAYYRFVRRGRFTLEYTVRYNNPGVFQLPPSRVEAMYAPEMMGLLPNAPLEVTPGP